jgi:hypothetical protein
MRPEAYQDPCRNTLIDQRRTSEDGHSGNKKSYVKEDKGVACNFNLVRTFQEPSR